MNKEYRIIYTESAIRDMEEKADYISLSLHDPGLAEKWYLRLKSLFNISACADWRDRFFVLQGKKPQQS